MSRENVEIVRRVFEVATGGEVAAVLDLYHPEVEWDTRRHPAGHIAGSGLYRGHGGLRTWFRSWNEDFDEMAYEIEELIDAGDQVVSVSTWRGRGRASGVEVEWKRHGGLWTIRDGRITRVVWFANPAEALEAAQTAGEQAADLVGRARAVMDAVARRDIDFLVQATDPQVEWRSFFAELGERGTYRGHDALRRYVGDLHDAWEIVRPDVTSAIEVGDVVLLVGRIHYRGRGSGAEASEPAGWTLRFRNGKVMRFAAFRDPEHAIERLALDAEPSAGG